MQAIEEQLGFRLPEDFKYLFGNLHDPEKVLFDFQKKDYDASIDRVWERIAFDIEHDVWLDRWGNRPVALEEALYVARSDFLTWPKLLPIFGHRYLAADYLMIEFLQDDYAEHMRGAHIQRIDVWSDFAEDVYKPYQR